MDPYSSYHFFKGLEQGRWVGYHNWDSGVTRLNLTVDEWQVFQPQSLTPSQIHITEAISHENFHLLQACTTGFPYLITAEYLRALLSNIPVEETRGNWDKLLALKPAVVDRFRELNELLCEKVGGLCALDIIEGSAFYVQKGAWRPSLSASEYAAMLNESPGPEYRIAFDAVEEKLGPSAFALFPLLAMVSLCSYKPASSFVNLVELVAKRGLHQGNTADPMQIWKLLESAQGTEFKTAHELKAEGHYSHIVYDDIIDKLKASRHYHPIKFFAEPHKWFSTLLEEGAVCPIVFNRSDDGDRPIWLPEHLWSQKSEPERNAIGEKLLFLMAYSSAIRTAIRGQ